ncbi:MAG: hypothetical protein MR009_03310 [Sutterellaceae bacterium]|nr:hypothetical protein [Sutterellaceae bacterium]MDD7441423.1 hypothetical protein [Sutterellaceae bacterium]MDY2869061.1 hypothetical protein [Mesosutterella sp.]
MRSTSGSSKRNEIERLREMLSDADSIVVGAGSGLSTSAGFTYSGARFEKYFPDFASAYGIRDMYTGGFHAFPTSGIRWGWWCRHIWLNRYVPAPRPVYPRLLRLLSGRDFFVVTTNVDHQFLASGFPKDRLFYTQGDYGLFQCSLPCHDETHDNRAAVEAMVRSEGWEIAPDGTISLPEERSPSMEVPPDLIPRCPKCGREMTPNLRSDDTFVEDARWHEAALRYERFLETHRGGKVLFLDLGSGWNTPGIFKHPFWRMTYSLRGARYACVNLGDAVVPDEIREKSSCVDSDIGAVIDLLLGS